MPALALAIALLQGAASAPASRPASRPSDAPGIALDKVVAIVNDDVITYSEVQLRLAPTIEQQGNPDPARIEALRRDLIVGLAVEKLLAQAAKRHNFDPASIDAIVKKRLEDEERAAGGHQQLLRNLERQGRSFADHERELHDDALTERLQGAELGFDQRPENDVTLMSPGLLRAHYRERIAEYHRPAAANAREILISTSKAGSAEKALARARELRAEIQGGADFDAVAARESEWKPADGGRLGWVEEGGGDPLLERTLLSLPIGALSEPIELEGGVALVRVDERRPAGVRPFSDPDVQKRVAEDVLARRRNEVFRKLLSRLLNDAYVWPPNLLKSLGIR